MPAALVAAALGLSACTTSQPSSAGKFQGTEQQVAQVVEDLQKAGRSKDADRICSDLLSHELVAQLKSGGSDCVDEMHEAISDTDDFDLEVRDVTVTGDRASARVQQGKKGRTATFQFAKEAGGWRVTSLAQ